jgi:beta-D-xylosidase 4
MIGLLCFSAIAIASASITPLSSPALANGSACSQPEVQSLPFCNTSLSFAERVADVVARLTLDEAGGQLTARQAPSIPRLGIPSFYWGTNAVHGITNAPLGGELCVPETGRCVTIWPSGPAMGSSWNASMWNVIGHTTGLEMRALGNSQWGPIARPGVGMDGLTSWGPTINLVRDPRWGRIQETTGECPYLNGVFATQVTRGMQEGEDSRYLLAATTLKHFAVYSLEDYTDPVSHVHSTRENIDNDVSVYDLADSYSPHFAAAVTPVAAGGGGAAGVMMAMNEVNEIPCLAHPGLIALLRGWAGPTGLYITTDGINMVDSMDAAEPDGHGYCPYHDGLCSRNEGIKAALAAGSDICDGSEYKDNLMESINAGNATLASVQTALFNAFMIRFRLGLFDPTEGQPFLTYGAELVNTDDARAANMLAAQEGLVLLANPGPVLPFTTSGTTLVVGYAAAGVSWLTGNYVGQFCPDKTDGCFPSILAAITATAGTTVTYAQGCASATDCSAKLIAAAAAAAGNAAVSRIVLTLGLDQSLEREQLDRVNITLPAPQVALFMALRAAAPSTPLAVVLVHGGAIALPEVVAAPVAILDAFYPGTLGGSAIASALFGAYNPGGKLTSTVYGPDYTSQVDFTDMDVSRMGRTYRFHKELLSPGGPPMFHFGFGLSYTQFSMAWAGPPPAPIAFTPTEPSVTLSVVVSTPASAPRDGDTVVQLYLIPKALPPQPPPMPPVFTPLLQLFAFQRVRVAGSGGQTVVTLNVDTRTTGMHLTLGNGTRTALDGYYDILVSTGDPGVNNLTVKCTFAGFCSPQGGC